MALYVVAYPRFDSAAEARRIEGLRREHDPQAEAIAAHVTLVFGVAGISPEVATAHLRAVAVGHSRFAVGFTAAALRQGITDRDFYAYLLPDEGAQVLVDLHDALRGGPFAGQKVLPYEPHITLGRAPGPAALERLVAEVNARRRVLRATVDSLNLLEVDGGGISLVAVADLP